MQKAKRILRNLNKRTAFNSMVQRCYRYMIPGWYHVDFLYGKAVLKLGAFQKPFSFKSMMKLLLFGVYRIKNPNPIAECNMALCSPFDNHKLFDENNAIVYTLFTDSFWSRVKLFCSTMQPFFKTEIRLADDDNHVLLENYVKEAKTVDFRACFNFLCDEFKAYVDKAAKNGKTVTASAVKKSLDSAELPSSVRQYLDHVEKNIKHYNTQYPVIVCHNDVNIDNILSTDNRTFSLIDFECCGENVFFFDFLGLIFNSAVFKNKPALYHDYIQGVLDSQIDELFKASGVKYDPNDKEEYLFLFLLFKIYMIHASNPRLLSMYTERIWSFFRNNDL